MADIKQTKELIQLIANQNKLYESQSRILQGSLHVMNQMARLFHQMNPEGAAKSAEEMSQSISDAVGKSQAWQEHVDMMQKVNGATKESAGSFDSLSNKIQKFSKTGANIAVVGSAIEGFVGGLKVGVNIMSSMVSVGQTLISSLFNLGAAIISVPFKILNGLMSMAAQGGGSGLREAIEEVREQFGALAKNESRAIMDAWRSIDKFGGQLAETGLRIWRTMGNMAEIMQKVTEMAKAMGVNFSNLKNQLAEQPERLFAYVKGLGLSEDAQKALAERSHALGVSLVEQGRQITQMAYGMGDAFGINGKLISRDMGEMMVDFKNFGNLAVEQLSSIAVYARKLGVEVKALLGVIDKFDNFEDAANSVAQLSQAFGLNLDTLKLVKAQDPAERIEMLRKAFFNAGKSVETMTRQERALLSQQTGLDESTARLVFSMKNQGLSYAQIQKQSDLTKKKQITQEEAMVKLADSIKRLVKSGSALQGTFFDIFAQGFLKGIMRTEEFWELMRNLRRAMRAVFHAGREVGQMFVKFFPGVQDVLGGIRDLFDPTRFSEMTMGVVEAFRKFFAMMTTDPRTALPELLENLKKNFFSWFQKGTPAGEKVLEGFKKFFKAFGEIAGSLLKEAIKGVTKGIRFIVDLIKNPDAALAGMKAGAGGFMGFLIEVFAPLYDAIVSTVPDLGAALLELLQVVWEWLKPKIIAMLPYVAGILFGPAIVGGLARGFTAALTKALVLGASSLLVKAGGPVITKVSGMIAKALGIATEGAQRTAQAAAGTAPEAGAQAAEVTRGAGAVTRATRTFSLAEAKSLVLKLTAIGVGLAIGGVAVAGGLLAIYHLLKLGGITTVEEATVPLMVIAATVLGMVGVALAVRLLSVAAGSSGGTISRAVLGILAVSAVSILMAGNFWLISKIVGGIEEGQVMKVVKVLGIMVLAYMAGALIIAAAAGIGVIMTAGYGLGTLAIIAGLIMIAAVVTGAALHIIEIMRVIDAFEPKPGFKAKAEVFTSILVALGEFAGSLAAIIDTVTPGLSGIMMSAWGRNPQQETRRTIGMLPLLIDTISGSLTKVLQSITQSMNELPSDPRKLEAAKVIGPLLSALLSAATDLMEAIQKPGEVASGLLAQPIAPEIYKAAGNYVQRVSQSIGVLIAGMAMIMRQIAITPIINESAVTTFSNFLGAAASLMKALAPGDVTTGVFALARSVDHWEEMMRQGAGLIGLDPGAGTDPANSKTAEFMRFLQAYTGMMAGLLKGPLLENISQFINKLAALAVSTSKEDLDKLQVIVPIFTGLVDLIKEFSEFMTKYAGALSVGGDALFQTNLDRLIADVMKKIIDPLSEGMPRIASSMLTALKDATPAQLSLIQKGFEALPALFSSITSIQEASAALAKGDAVTAIPQEIFDTLSSNITQLTTAYDTILVKGAEDMVAKINNVTRILNSMRPQNVRVGLERLGNALGVMKGSTDMLAINMKDLKIEIKIDVSIDADELEHTLAGRNKGSVFRVHEDRARARSIPGSVGGGW